MIAVIIIASIIGYATMVGLVNGTAERIQRPYCRYNVHDADCWHWWKSFWASIFWPVALPLVVGIGLSHMSPTNYTDRRRQKEIDEADHKIAIARKNAEAIKIAERSVLDRSR
jgi:hypothetical protein